LLLALLGELISEPIHLLPLLRQLSSELELCPCPFGGARVRGLAAEKSYYLLVFRLDLRFALYGLRFGV